MKYKKTTQVQHHRFNTAHFPRRINDIQLKIIRPLALDPIHHRYCYQGEWIQNGEAMLLRTDVEYQMHTVLYCDAVRLPDRDDVQRPFYTPQNITKVINHKR